MDEGGGIQADGLSTKSLVLGKAKVMSFEDLEAARAKRAAKEKAKATTGTGKRGRKPKNAVPEGEEATAGKAKRGRKRKNLESDGEAGPLEPRKTRVVRMSEAPESVRALAAKMI